MEVFRLCKERHAALDGEGARLYGGRWNLAGTPLVYTSATLSLAVLEFFVNLDPSLAPDDLVALGIDVPDSLRRRVVAASGLPRNWRRTPAPEALARLGTLWAESRESAVLQVPSAVVPAESNFLLNPAHRDFTRVRAVARERFVMDRRLRK